MTILNKIDKLNNDIRDKYIAIDFYKEVLIAKVVEGESRNIAYYSYSQLIYRLSEVYDLSPKKIEDVIKANATAEEITLIA